MVDPSPRGVKLSKTMNAKMICTQFEEFKIAKMSAKLQLQPALSDSEDESDGSNSSLSQDNMALDQKEIPQATAAADGEWDQIETEGNLGQACFNRMFLAVKWDDES